MNGAKITGALSIKPNINKQIPGLIPQRIKRPSPLPLRPLQPNRFVPPRGQKQVFLPNIVLTLLRTPNKPAHFASFLVPLSFNKLDIKSYLYNAYGIRVLHVRSYIIHGKVVRDPQTRRLSRTPRKKQMTIEMEMGKGFVWPDAPEDLSPWDKEHQDEIRKEKEERKKGTSEQGTFLGLIDEGAKKTLHKQAKALRSGAAKWRPGWEEYPFEGMTRSTV